MIYLIDGHNLIGQNRIPGIDIHQEDDEARLVAWLRARQPHLGARMVVVFDGGIPGGRSLNLSGGGVDAIFAAQRRSDADTVILQRVRRAARPQDLVVVTNDTALRNKAQRLGAQGMRVDVFLERLQRPSPRHRAPQEQSPLEDEDPRKENPRLSPEELEAFLRLFGQG